MLRETERERGFCCFGFFYSKTEMCPNELNIISETYFVIYFIHERNILDDFLVL